MNVFNEYNPLAAFFIPEGWTIVKNNVYDVDLKYYYESFRRNEIRNKR